MVIEKSGGTFISFNHYGAWMPLSTSITYLYCIFILAYLFTFVNNFMSSQIPLQSFIFYFPYRYYRIFLFFICSIQFQYYYYVFIIFQIKSYKKETENKTIRFPITLIEDIEKAIRGKNVTFSRFVIQACEYALNNMDRTKKDSR